MRTAVFTFLEVLDGLSESGLVRRETALWESWAKVRKSFTVFARSKWFFFESERWV